MLPRVDMQALRAFGAELNDCGKHWGENVDLSGSGNIIAHTGDTAFFETTINGVIGMHGNEVGKGPAIIIKDVNNSGIDMIWTNGLTGCMCIAIIGRDESGKLDAFFCHARHYDEKDAVRKPDNPMFLAREFIQTHQDIRVFWGTNFNYGVRDFSGPLKKDEAQKLLSNELGCWVRNDDCVMASELVFFPKLGLLKNGKPKEAYAWARAEDLKARSDFSMSMALSKFAPDAAILIKLEDHLRKLRDEMSSIFRFYPYDSRRTNKILVLEQVIDAYRVGNLDRLRSFADNARNNSSPFRDESTINAWYARDDSMTAKLVIEACDDVVRKISSMGSNGCGLRSDGQSIHSFREYKDMVDARMAVSRKLGP